MAVSAEIRRTQHRTTPLQDALECLDDLDPRKACIARMRLVGRLTLDQIASYLGLPQAAIAREWRFTRAWLVRETGC